MCSHGKAFDIIPICPISQWAALSDWGPSAMSWRSKPHAPVWPAPNKISRGSRMDIRKVKKLIELLEESGISELEISEGEESVRISRHPRMGMQVAATQAAPVMHAAPAAAAIPATSAGEHTPRNDEHTVTSPMVGTYYSSASPG